MDQIQRLVPTADRGDDFVSLSLQEEFPHSQRSGDAQRRYRAELAREGWRPICTYMRTEHRIALEWLRRQHELKTLHEALDLVLATCPLPPFGSPASMGEGRSMDLPCLTAEEDRRCAATYRLQPLPETAAARTEEEKSR